MGRFILRRVVQLVLVLLAVTFMAFSALNFLGDPLVNVIGPLAAIDYCDEVEAGLREDSFTTLNNLKGDCEIIAEAKEQYGLDKSVPVRYVTWLGDIVTGDLGTSFQTQLPVSEIIRQKLPKSLLLMVMAEIVALAIAIPVGVYSAYRAGRAVDRATSVASFGLLSVPNFALGVVMLQFFALRNQVTGVVRRHELGTRIHSSCCRRPCSGSASCHLPTTSAHRSRHHPKKISCTWPSQGHDRQPSWFAPCVRRCSP